MEPVYDETLGQQGFASKEKPSFKPHAKFTPEDDELLRSLVGKAKNIDWCEIAHMMPGRNQRQCRERWTNYLCPTINTSEWTPEEDSVLKEKVEQLGKKWVKISKFFNHRTDQMCKNRFNILERKKLNLKRGRKPSSAKKIVEKVDFSPQLDCLPDTDPIKNVYDQTEYFYPLPSNDYDFHDYFSEPDDNSVFFFPEINI